MNKILIALVLAVVMSGNVFSASPEPTGHINYYCPKYNLGFQLQPDNKYKTRTLQTQVPIFVVAYDIESTKLYRNNYGLYIEQDYYRLENITVPNGFGLSRLLSIQINRKTEIVSLYYLSDRKDQIEHDMCTRYGNFQMIENFLQKKLNESLNRNRF